MAIKFREDFDKNYTGPKVDSNGVPIPQPDETKFSFLIVLFWISIVIVIAVGLIAIAPLASLVLFVFVGMFFIVTVVFPTIFTLGLVWAIDSYRVFQNNVTFAMVNIFNDDGIVSLMLSQMYLVYWYILYIGGPIVLIGLVWSILDYKSEDSVNPLKKKRMIGFIVLSAIFAVAAIIAGIFAVSSK